MIQDVWIIQHVGHGQLPFLEYLYRVLLYLLAFAAVALGTRLLIHVFAARTAGAAVKSDAEKQE